MEITLEAVLLEADKVNINATPDNAKPRGGENTDYGAEDEGTIDATGANEPEPDNTDYGADAPEEEAPPEEEPAEDTGDAGTDYGADAPEDEAGGGEETGEDTPEDGGDEGTDYGDEMPDENLDGGGDEGGDANAQMDMGTGSTTEETPEQLQDRDKKVKQLLLLKNMVALYNSVQNYNDIVATMDKPNVVVSAIQSTVSANFSKLYNMIYRYIMYYFDKMSYEYNLYSYNYFIEACKINIELLAKIMKPADTVSKK